ncbi:pectinesterase family protein [Rhodanobacter sp. A1T4]|uniref:pectinesterase family protein n=1 Tax=Rhodanobacter sp. A1T4 TaxID=2723087 RepID=UPI001610DD89|nr:pectin methylesterase-like acyl-CoA thioesterase [Rhodanobacter sp. A1T4]
MKHLFKRKRSSLLIAQTLAVMAASLAIPAHAQYYNVIDSNTRTTLIGLLQFRLPGGANNLSAYDKAPVIVAAHRGVVDENHPENTVESAVNTMNYGIESLELDVYESSDHVPYLMHDKTLQRMVNRPEYSDIYRWAREGGAADLETPSWSDITTSRMCTGADGYGKTDAHPFCYDSSTAAMFPDSLEDAFQALYNDSYEGLVFLDLREYQNVRDVAAQVARDVAAGNQYGLWVARHVVLKFQTVLFNGPEDFYQKTANYYQTSYGGTLTESSLAQLYVMPVYTSNVAANQDGGGANDWAINDYSNWINWNEGNNNVLSPEASLKAIGSSLNYGQDDMFTILWQAGRNIGAYIPESLCTVAQPSASNANLSGSEGTYWEGGFCGPVVPPMNANECGNASTTEFNRGGIGCTDHRPFTEFWHDYANFGFIITDRAEAAVQYLSGFPGQRPSNANTSCTGSTTGSCNEVIHLQQPALVVAADGSGSYTTINAALAAMPAAGGMIQIRPGTYHEKVNITQPNVELVGTGSDASQVVITNDDYSGKVDALGNTLTTSTSYTVKASGANFYASNLTIQNTADYESPNFQNNGQAVALFSLGDRAVFRAVLLLGGQDTLYLGNDSRAYFNNSYIEGYVDYIFGNGKVVFDNCLIKTKVHGDLNGEATITAQNRASASEDSGFVFTNSQLLFDSPYMTNVWLGRPWGAYATTYFLNTKMGPEVVKQGWIEFIPLPVSQGGTNNLPTSTYREYDSYYPGANSTWTTFDLSQRESTSPQSNVPLTSSQAAALAPNVYLAGSDSWTPTSVTYGGNTNQTLPVPTPAVGVPNAPIITATTGGNGNIQVTWAGQPANPVEQGYTLTATQDGNTFGPVSLPPSASTSYIDGLANGVPAKITVMEFNAQGSSGPSISSSVTPVSHDPSAPTDVQVTPTSNSATVNFSIKDQGIQPVFGGTVAHAGVYGALYASQADAYAGNAIAGTNQGFTTSSWTVTNLQPNTTYWLSLQAYNGYWSPIMITSFTTNQ